jgi:hypothetical protein
MASLRSFLLAILLAFTALSMSACERGDWDKGQFSGDEKDGKIYVFVLRSDAYQKWARDGTLPKTAVTFSGPKAPNGQTVIAENDKVLAEYIGEKRYNQWKADQKSAGTVTGPSVAPQTVSPNTGE